MSDGARGLHSITVVGLGPGDPGHLTVAARDALEAASAVWLRTSRHPGIELLRTSAPVRSFDDLYVAAESFADVYAGIAKQLVREAANGPVVYAVPGDPATYEASVGLLQQAAEAAGAPLRVLPGVSFLGPTLAEVGWQSTDDLQLADATSLARRHYPALEPDRPALVAQVYSRLVASDLKLTLLGAYPPEHEVIVVTAAGTEECRVRRARLAELDHEDAFDDLTSVAVPALSYPSSISSLADVVARLRAPDGCPWDREQTHESLRPYLLEEAYEVLAALDSGDEAALADELGDLLLQIVLHAQLASETSVFNMSDVSRAITEKIVRRHPHVFGGDRADTSEEVRGLWEELKATERAERGGPVSPFAGVPEALPALARAQAVLRKAVSAGRVGSAEATAHGLRMAESSHSAFRADAPEDPSDSARAVGQALWGLVVAAQVLGVDAETALREVTADRLGALAATDESGQLDDVEQLGDTI